MHTIIMISCPGLTLIGLSGTAQDQPLPCSRHSDRRARTKNYDFSWWTIIFLMGGGVGWCWKVFTCKRYGSWCWLTKSGLFGNACGFRTDSLACIWVLTSFVPSPLKFPVCHESKLHTKWLLSVSGKEEGLEGGVLIPHSRPFFARIPHPARFSSVSRIPLFFPTKIH